MEVCQSSKQAKGEEIRIGSYNNFRQSMFLHEQQAESKKEELGVGETMQVIQIIFGTK